VARLPQNRDMGARPDETSIESRFESATLSLSSPAWADPQRLCAPRFRGQKPSSTEVVRLE